MTCKHSGRLSSVAVRLTGPGPGAVLAGGLFAASRLSWQWSMVAEVFALNNLFVGLLLVLTAFFHCAESAQQRMRVTQLTTTPPTGSAHCFEFYCRKKCPSSQVARWGALCCALGLCNQHTLVLYVAIVAPWVLQRLYSHGVSFQKFLFRKPQDLKYLPTLNLGRKKEIFTLKKTFVPDCVYVF